jgi:23S rRNA (pseudouridine1915-N3)-methyltransferase
VKLNVIAVGQRMPAWIDAGFEEYARRMPRTLPMRLAEVKPEPRGEGAPVDRLKDAEAKRIQAAIPAGCFKVVLDERGRTCTTRELAQRISTWQMEGRDVAFVIGGADGLAAALKADADWLWSLSSLTLPHGLVRVVVAEQLYRAVAILGNHPYHRE